MEIEKLDLNNILEVALIRLILRENSELLAVFEHILSIGNKYLNTFE